MTPDQRVHAVRADNKVGSAAVFQIIDRVKMPGLDTHGTGPRLQNLQQSEACDAGVSHAVDEEFESPFGEDQAEAECGVGWVLLENLNLEVELAALEQVGKIKASRAGADNRDSHRHPFTFVMIVMSIPVAAITAESRRPARTSSQTPSSHRDDLGSSEYYTMLVGLERKSNPKRMRKTAAHACPKKRRNSAARPNVRRI